MKKVPLFIVVLLMPLSLAYGQTNSDTVDDLENRLKSEEFNVGLLLQSVGVLSLDDDSFNGGRQFELGATRLDIKGQLPSNFIYRMQLDFRRSPSIIDAQVGYRFSDQFRIVTGMFKPFLSSDLDPSPAATDFINRARLVGSMLNSRELGITALGETEGFNYRFGIYNGNGRQLGNDDNNFLYTARLGYQVNLEDNGTV
ncbi:MAG: porin, partial [Bacteroidota bacterium]